MTLEADSKIEGRWLNYVPSRVGVAPGTDQMPWWKERFASPWAKLLRVQAVTLNGTVHFRKEELDYTTLEYRGLLGHELYHVKQQREWKFGFPSWLAVYLALQLKACLGAWCRGKAFQPRLHPWELPAYEFEDGLMVELTRQEA